MGILAIALAGVYYVVVGLYAVAATCVAAGCVGAVATVLVRDLALGAVEPLSTDER